MVLGICYKTFGGDVIINYSYNVNIILCKQQLAGCKVLIMATASINIYLLLNKGTQPNQVLLIIALTYIVIFF